MQMIVPQAVKPHAIHFVEVCAREAVVVVALTPVPEIATLDVQDGQRELALDVQVVAL